MKTLSIIIPCYNAADTISRTIESFDLDNTQNDIEVLIVDDGSSDNSKKVIEKYIKKYPKAIKYYKKKNGNYGSVVNFIKPRIKTKFVKTCDADDTYVKENMVRFIESLKSLNDSADVVFTNFNFVNTGTNKKNKNSLTNQFKWVQATTIFPINNISKSIVGYPTIHSMCFRTEIFKVIPDSPENIFYTDSFTIYQCLKRAFKIAYIPHLYVYNYYVSNEEQSINITNISNRKDQILTVLSAILEDSDLTGLTKRHKSWLISIIQMIIKFAFLSISFNKEPDEVKVKEIEDVIKLVKHYVNHNEDLRQIFDLQIWYMFNTTSRSLIRKIRRCYGITLGKFARSSRPNKKDKRRAELSNEFYHPNEDWDA